MLRLILALALVGCTPKAAPVAEVAPVVEEGHVNKSPNDPRTYRAIMLDNGMKVTLISDPETDIAAAALDVHVGQFSDPEDRQGLAHFLEHMLFMGTEKYPDVDGYRKFIQENGGGTNAGTGQEHTTYHFTVAHGSLAPALDRFAQFFISPKLDPEYVDRERNAVNAEYQLKIAEDARRIREVKRATGNPDHPFHKFSVGNLDTLADRPSDTVHEDLLSFYKEHYSASRMSLSVIGRESLDQLEDLATQMFSAVPTNGSTYQASPVAPFTASELGVWVNIIPKAEMRMMEVQFPTPSETPYWRVKPVDYITAMLNAPHTGSLKETLESRGWITSMSASSNGGSDAYTQIAIRFNFTEEGWEKREQVMGEMYSYIAQIRRDGVRGDLYDEQGQIQANVFRFLDVTSPVQAVRGTAYVAQYLPAEHLLDNRYVYDAFEPDLVRSYLDKMVPSNARVLTVAEGLETDKVQELYDTPYGVYPIAPELLEAWSNAEPLEGFTLRELNPWVVTELDMEPVESVEVVPSLQVDTPALQLWHQLDTSFETPEANVVLRVFAPTAQDGSRSRVLSMLYVAMLNQNLSAEMGPIRRAGFSGNVSASGDGLIFRVSGWDQRQAEILDLLMSRAKEIELDETVFKAEKENILRALKNFKVARPINQSWTEMSVLLDTSGIGPDDLETALEPISLDDLRAFHAELFNGAAAQLLVHGNISDERAEAMGARVTEVLLSSDPAALPTRVVRQIPEGQEVVRNLAIDHHDASIVIAYQGQSAEVEESARWSMLQAAMRTDFFTELRTKQQLGYVVNASWRRADTIPYLMLSIQSANTDVDTLEQRIDAFLGDFETTLAELSAEEFDTIREGLVTQIMKKDRKLGDRFGRYRSELNRGITNFDSRDQMVGALSSLTPEDILNFYRERVLAPGVGRVITRSEGTAHPVEKLNGCDTRTCATDQMKGTFERSL